MVPHPGEDRRIERSSHMTRPLFNHEQEGNVCEADCRLAFQSMKYKPILMMVKFAADVVLSTNGSPWSRSAVAAGPAFCPSIRAADGCGLAVAVAAGPVAAVAPVLAKARRRQTNGQSKEAAHHCFDRPGPKGMFRRQPRLVLATTLCRSLASSAAE